MMPSGQPGLRGHVATTRFASPGAATITVRLNPGGHYVTREPNEMIATILGSCVAACIRDPSAAIGGMNHFMLPRERGCNEGSAETDLRYGDVAMRRLIGDILRQGGRRQRLEVKVFGGGNVIEAGVTIGEQNADFVEAYLRDGGFTIAAADLRGSSARRIHYFPLTGRVMMLEMPRKDMSRKDMSRKGMPREDLPAQGAARIDRVGVRVTAPHEAGASRAVT